MHGRNERGREARKPEQIPKEGWKDIALRVNKQLQYDNVQFLAAAIAFYFFLALFPAITAALSIYGLLMSPLQVQQQMGELVGLLPGQIGDTISEFLHALSVKPDQTLGWSLVVSTLISLWSANMGTTAVFEGVNIAYHEADRRNYILRKAITLLFTIGGILLGFTSLSLVVAFPAFIEYLGLPEFLQGLIGLGRWLLLAGIFTFALALIYKVAPYRDKPKFRWVTWGAVIATVLWLAGSVLFSYYVDNFGKYDITYGSFATIIILLMWLFLTGYAVLIGAEINSEMEHQTRKDTTVGREMPLGQRDAYYADHVAGEN